MNFSEIKVGIVAVRVAIGGIQINHFFKGAHGAKAVRFPEALAAFLKQGGDVVARG
jgi:hypothetical protein